MASMSFARAVIPVGIAAMRAMNSAVPTLCYLLSAVVLLSYHNNYGMFKGERIISSVFFLFFPTYQNPPSSYSRRDSFRIHLLLRLVLSPWLAAFVPFSLPSLFPLRCPHSIIRFVYFCLVRIVGEWGLRGNLFYILMMMVDSGRKKSNVRKQQIIRMVKMPNMIKKVGVNILCMMKEIVLSSHFVMM